LDITNTAHAPEEIATSMKELVKAGFDAKTALSGVESISRLATIAQEDLGKMTVAVSSQFRAWNEDIVGTVRGVSSMEQVANMLGFVAGKTALDVGELTEQLAYATELAPLSGASFGELTAAMGWMSNMGIHGTKAMTSLRTAVLDLQSPSGKAGKLMHEMGVEFEAFNSDGSAKSLVDLFSALSDSLAHLGSEERIKVLDSMMGGVRNLKSGMQVIQALDADLRNSAGGFRDLVAETNKAGKELEYINRVFKDVSDTTKGQMALALAEAKKALTGAFDGTAVRQFLKEVRAAAADGSLQKLASDLMIITGWLIKSTAFIVAHKEAVAGLVAAWAFSSILGGLASMAGAIAKVAGAQGLFNILVAANPWLRVAGILAGLTAAAALYFNSVSEGGAKVEKSFSDVEEAIRNAGGGIPELEEALRALRAEANKELDKKGFMSQLFQFSNVEGGGELLGTKIISKIAGFVKKQNKDFADYEASLEAPKIQAAAQAAVGSSIIKGTYTGKGLPSPAKSYSAFSQAKDGIQGGSPALPFKGFKPDTTIAESQQQAILAHEANLEHLKDLMNEATPLYKLSMEAADLWEESVKKLDASFRAQGEVANESNPKYVANLQEINKLIYENGKFRIAEEKATKKAGAAANTFNKDQENILKTQLATAENTFQTEMALLNTKQKYQMVTEWDYHDTAIRLSDDLLREKIRIAEAEKVLMAARLTGHGAEEEQMAEAMVAHQAKIDGLYREVDAVRALRAAENEGRQRKLNKEAAGASANLAISEMNLSGASELDVLKANNAEFLRGKREALAEAAKLDKNYAGGVTAAHNAHMIALAAANDAEFQAKSSLASFELGLLNNSVESLEFSEAKKLDIVKRAKEARLIDAHEAAVQEAHITDNVGGAIALKQKELEVSMKSSAEIAADAWGAVPGLVSDGLITAFDDIINGTATVADAFRNMASQILASLAQMIMKQMLYNMVVMAGKATGFFADGGLVGGKGYAEGGAITGYSPNPRADNIPIMATAGEYMQPVKAVDYYGLGFMQDIRDLRFPREDRGHRPPSSSYRLADGGSVPDTPQQPTNFVGGDTKLQVVNVLDKNLMGDFMASASGQTTLINMIRRNGSTIRTILGG
jgi:TP901 family phage tail tape measure protein